MSILKYVIIIFLFTFTVVLASDNFITRSLLCSTSDFPIKGGFYFEGPNNLIRYNILRDNNSKKEFVSVSRHCYLEIDNEIAVSMKSPENGCGSYSSFIDMNTLIYSIPTEQSVLTAKCSYFKGDIFEKIKSSINRIYN